MSKKSIISHLKTARNLYVVHKQNRTKCIEFWANECLKYREMLKVINA